MLITHTFAFEFALCFYLGLCLRACLRLSLRLRLCLCLCASYIYAHCAFVQTLKNTNTIGGANTQATHKTRQVAFFVLGTSQREKRVKRINLRSETRFL